MQVFEVASYPHKMIEWEQLMSNQGSGKKVILYYFALGLTSRHPAMRDNCYFTVRHTYRMVLNNQPAFRAVGETVYKLRLSKQPISEDLLLQLVKHTHNWFINEFNERKQGSILHYTDAPSFIPAEVLPL